MEDREMSEKYNNMAGAKRAARPSGREIRRLVEEQSADHEEGRVGGWRTMEEAAAAKIREARDRPVHRWRGARSVVRTIGPSACGREAWRDRLVSRGKGAWKLPRYAKATEARESLCLSSRERRFA